MSDGLEIVPFVGMIPMKAGILLRIYTLFHQEQRKVSEHISFSVMPLLHVTLLFIKALEKGRHHLPADDKPRQAKPSRVYAEREKEPWLLATSLITKTAKYGVNGKNGCFFQLFFSDFPNNQRSTLSSNFYAFHGEFVVRFSLVKTHHHPKHLLYLVHQYLDDVDV